MSAWLSVVGIGEDGLAGLSQAARTIIAAAEVLVGGKRHHAFVPETGALRVEWASPLALTLDALETYRGKRVVVLASGDPMWFGVGATLARRFGTDALHILPHVSAYALAAARLAWPLGDTGKITIHGRPLAALAVHLHDRARLIVLTHDGASPAAVAKLLVANGYGKSRLVALERLGGPAERALSGIAQDWPHEDVNDLNTLAIECVAGPDARRLSRLAGLPDDCFEHDGQLTKRIVRAATLAALSPLPGQLLWDVGAGNGSISIEWLRAAPRMRAIAIERDAARRTRIARNAETLGVPDIEIVAGEAPSALSGLKAPDAVFIGGGASIPGVVEACWAALKPGGMFVANAVTLESEAMLTGWHAKHGGELARIGVSHAEPIGPHRGWRTAMPVTQISVRKP
jgi:precorrin-6Y C5,15-methyltransferase (decarboxylating)